jgi:hypothetical protein
VAEAKVVSLSEELELSVSQVEELTDALTEATEGDKEEINAEAFTALESKILQEQEENSLKDTIIEELDNEIASQKEHLCMANQCIEDMETGTPIYIYYTYIYICIHMYR